MIHTVKEIDMARTCLRKWAAKYLHRVEDPKHPNAADGIEMHSLLQRMCGPEGPAANAQPESKVGRWARALYGVTPPGVKCELEQSFALGAELSPDQPARRASFRIDFTLVGPTGGFIAFGDWKSTAGPKYALAPPNAAPEAQQKALGNDLQANLEAFGFMRVFGLDAVPIRWLYVDKKTDRTWSVDAHMTLAGTTEWLQENALPWMRVVERLRALHAAGQTPPLQMVPHEPIACDGVGRMCSFLGACQMRESRITTVQIKTWANAPETTTTEEPNQ